MMQSDVMILCGGKGERLRSLISDRPKPLASFQGQPFLDFLIEDLLKQNFQHFILLAGYQGDKIQAYAEQKNRELTAQVECIIEHLPLGTAGALHNSLTFVTTSMVLVLNGDSYCQVDYRQMFRFHNEHSANMTIATSPCKDAKDYGTIITDEKGRIRCFSEKAATGCSSWVNAGIYILEKNMLEMIPTGRNISLEQEMIPQWLSNEKVIYAYPCQTEHLDIGTPERFATAQEFFQQKGSKTGDK